MFSTISDSATAASSPLAPLPLLSIKAEPFHLGQAAAPLKNALECSVSTTTVVVDAWPASPDLDALCCLARAVGTGYGCVYVGHDEARAVSEQLLGVVKPYPWRDQPWHEDIWRMYRFRHEFGARVRDAYWGNFLSEHVVQAIGGVRALEETGASVVARISEALTYVQLTATVGDALSDEGEARRQRLRAVLAPVIVGR